MPETDQPRRHWLDRRPGYLLQALCAVAFAAFIVGEWVGVSRGVRVALAVPVILGCPLQLARLRQRGGGAPVFSKDPDDYR